MITSGRPSWQRWALAGSPPTASMCCDGRRSRSRAPRGRFRSSRGGRVRDCTTTTDRPDTGYEGRDDAAPARSLTRRVLARLGPAMCEVLLLAALYGLYELARGLVHGNVGTAEHRGRVILDWEQSWHVAVEHSLNVALGHVFALA